MKKIIAIMLMMVLLFTACGDKEIAKTDEELRAEVAAEMEAEAKLKEELKEELKKEIEEELRKEAVEEVVEEVKKADAYYIEDLKLGQSIAGCTVKDIEYIRNKEKSILGDDFSDAVLFRGNTPKTYLSELGRSIDE